MYFGIAANDDMRQPDAKDKLKRSVCGGEGASGNRGLSGGTAWLVRARHAETERQADLQSDDAERAWAKLVALYKGTLQS